MDKICVIASDGCKVGSELCKLLLSDGHTVYFISSFKKAELKNLVNCFSNKNFLFLNHDITENFSTPDVPDWIFNLTDYGSESLDKMFNKGGNVKYLHSPPDHIAIGLRHRMVA